MLSFPADAQTPIAAEIDFTSPVADGPLHCSLDWRRSEGEEWTIKIGPPKARVRLADGGGELFIDGDDQRRRTGSGEYPEIYRRFAS